MTDDLLARIDDLTRCPSSGREHPAGPSVMSSAEAARLIRESCEHFAAQLGVSLDLPVRRAVEDDMPDPPEDLPKPLSTWQKIRHKILRERP